MKIPFYATFSEAIDLFLGFGLLLFFVWVWRFTGCHMTGCGVGAVLVLHCFSLAISVCSASFSAHVLHGVMVKWAGRGCVGAMCPQKPPYEPRYGSGKREHDGKQAIL